MNQPGICYLVGAGPGDPGLMTVRGMECLRRADVVFYDHLVSVDILDEVSATAERIYVGKQPGRHTLAQEQINRLLCRTVRVGHVVVRLKGGDPFVFGRGGEEALALAQAGLRFELVPGVTAGVAAAAYAGIPVTHRGISAAVTFVTGHESSDKDQHQTNWHEIARSSHTLCIYMGVRNLAAICARLMLHGRSPQEPAAVVEWGTLPRQRCVTGTLLDIAAKSVEQDLESPALIIVGEVVNLRGALKWFEKSPQGSNGHRHNQPPRTESENTVAVL